MIEIKRQYSEFLSFKTVFKFLTLESDQSYEHGKTIPPRVLIGCYLTKAVKYLISLFCYNDFTKYLTFTADIELVRGFFSLFSLK